MKRKTRLAADFFDGHPIIDERLSVNQSLFFALQFSKHLTKQGIQTTLHAVNFVGEPIAKLAAFAAGAASEYVRSLPDTVLVEIDDGWFDSRGNFFHRDDQPRISNVFKIETEDLERWVSDAPLSQEQRIKIHTAIHLSIKALTNWAPFVGKEGRLKKSIESLFNTRPRTEVALS